eukprot:Sspe_Gene.61984::Locus_34562_Transcript_1_1_Confidence_1.000_Length_1780::g.61984::m.61984
MPTCTTVNRTRAQGDLSSLLSSLFPPLPLLSSMSLPLPLLPPNLPSNPSQYLLGLPTVASPRRNKFKSPSAWSISVVHHNFGAVRSLFSVLQSGFCPAPPSPSTILRFLYTGTQYDFPTSQLSSPPGRP